MNSSIFVTIPPEALSSQPKPGQLSADQLTQFFSDGFLILEEFFNVLTDLEPCKVDVEKLVDGLAQKLFKAGKITDLCENADFFHRLTLIEKQFPGVGILLHKQGILPDSVKRLWTHEKLLNIMEQLLGPDIAGSPVWNLRCKAPSADHAVVPWHQDNAYMDETAGEVLCITAWIPLLDANFENGTLQVLRGGHKTGKLAKHHGCWGDTWYVEADVDEMEKTLGVNCKTDAVVCNVPYGGVILFSNILPHRSLENKSDKIRWSFDLRWQDLKKPYSFHGLKEGIVFRTKEQPNLVPDWDTFCGSSHHCAPKEATESDFDTIIVGPWMLRWPIDHENRHTQKLKQLKEANQLGTNYHGIS